MAFPETIVTFTPRKDVTAQDGELISQFQDAIKAQDMALAQSILEQITDYSTKIITAAYLNSIASTCNALETYYLERYSPAYVVSANQPSLQQRTDFWFEITGVSS